MIESWHVREALRSRFGSELVDIPGIWDRTAALLQNYAPYRDTFGGLAERLEDVIFNTDGTCAITYTTGEMTGTYRASQDLIRIDAIADGEAHTMLWRVLSMSPSKIVAEYEHSFSNERKVKMTVTLNRL